MITDQAVLSSLESFRLAIHQGYETFGNGTVISHSNGLCGNIANDLNSISIKQQFKDIFYEMGLHRKYPVEMQIFQNEESAAFSYMCSHDKYNPKFRLGQARLKLLDDLIEYYSKKVELPIPNFDNYLNLL